LGFPAVAVPACSRIAARMTKNMFRVPVLAFVFIVFIFI
jgi:hypothetical protein